MKALTPQGLKLENWILDDLGNPAQVCTLGKNTIETRLENGWQTAFNPRPIPLTEEWLLKFGFEEKSTHLYRRVTNDFAFAFQISRISNNGWCSPLFGMRHPVQYVHQLQNLYWCLCGEELTISSSN